MDAPLPTPTSDHDQTQWPSPWFDETSTPRRHRSRERTRTGPIDTTPTRIEAQLHRKRMKHRETKRASHGKWRCMRVKNMVELGVQMPDLAAQQAKLSDYFKPESGEDAKPGNWFYIKSSRTTTENRRRSRGEGEEESKGNDDDEEEEKEGDGDEAGA